MERISDAHMSGTTSEAIVLHVSPEAADSGLFELVRDGDQIEPSADKRALSLSSR